MIKHLSTLSLILNSLIPVLSQTLDAPPPTPVRSVVEEYCGERVEDPYRYLENMRDSEVQQWFRAQADYTQHVLSQIPGRDQMKQQLQEVANRRASEVTQVKVTDNNRYFYFKTNQGEDVARLYYRDSYEGEENLLFDPTAYDTGSNKKYVVYFHYPSWDGSKVAFSITADGAEIGTLMIMDVAKKALYPEQIDRYWFDEFSWLPDNKRFLYLRLRSSDSEGSNTDSDNSKVLHQDSQTFLHQVGTSSSEDQEVLSRAHNPELGIRSIDFPLVYVSYPNRSHLVAELGGVSADRKVFIAPISQINEDSIRWQMLADIEDGVGKSVVAIQNNEIFVLTSNNAARFNIVKTTASDPRLKKAKVVIPEGNEVIKDFALTSSGLFYNTIANGVEANLYYLARGTQQPQKIKLPVKAGYISTEAVGQNSPDLWVGLGGWATPGTRYYYQTSTDHFIKQTLSAEAAYPEYQNLLVEEISVSSHDGTLVPLSIMYQKNTPLDGNAPLMLRGYGAYGYSMEPYFSPDFLAWTTKGGIFAVAHVRGGGELGDAWHRAGQKTTKPNTWKDFIACAEYLVEKGYTSSKRLSINSASAGGILIGRAMTERPDLFAVAIPQVGMMNVLRKEETPSGPANIKEYGAIQDSLECKALLEMDAYLHIEKNTAYPATLLTAGMNDYRVVPWQPAKFAARLQAASTSKAPVLFLVDYEAGHGLAGSKSKRAESLADVFSFALWQTGHPDFQPTP